MSCGYKDQFLTVRRMWYSGTAQLVQGQPLCYEETADDIDGTHDFPFNVEIPNTNNEAVFAGIVAENSAGLTGPCMVDVVIPRPGDVLQVLVSTYSAAIAVGDVLILDFDTPTATASVAATGGGAFVEWALSTTVASTVYSEQEALAKARKVLAMETLASVSASTIRARTLKWVQFI
jgi:hypothetical protein